MSTARRRLRRLVGQFARQLPANADWLYIEHFVANERASAFYEREAFAVQRIDRAPQENPALGVVWRARHLAPNARASRQA
jgi:hypothetical protein